MVDYVPERGDIIYLDLDPQAGHEMAKRHPCLVLSPRVLNAKLKRALICPITSTPPRIKTHVPIPSDVKEVSGTLIVDQIKSLDYINRRASKAAKLNDDATYSQVSHIIDLMING